MKLASFNVENLFARPKVFHRGDWSVGRAALEVYARLSGLLQEPTYTAAIRAKIEADLTTLGLLEEDVSEFVVLRQNRGALVRREPGEITVTAKGRADWVGWLELRMQLSAESCVRNTARVVSELNPDVIAVIEADNRPALKRFGRDFVASAPGAGGAFRHVMLIDGNDDRGIDVGIMTGKNFPITSMLSHVDDVDETGWPIFSRDCAEFRIRTPADHNLLVMVNHLKSRGYGETSESDARRRAQASRVAEIYRSRVDRYSYLAVVGDLNDAPGSDSLEPLLGETDLRDISRHPKFIDDGIPGTWGSGVAHNKLDYLLLSPALFDQVESGGVFRKGAWSWAQPPLWGTFDTLKQPDDAASDHAAIWAELDI